MSRDKTIEMQSSTATAIIGGGFAVGISSWGLCIASDAKYAAAAEAYNSRLSSDVPASDPARDVGA